MVEIKSPKNYCLLSTLSRSEMQVTSVRSNAWTCLIVSFNVYRLVSVERKQIADSSDSKQLNYRQHIWKHWSGYDGQVGKISVKKIGGNSRVILTCGFHHFPTLSNNPLDMLGGTSMRGMRELFWVRNIFNCLGSLQYRYTIEVFIDKCTHTLVSIFLFIFLQ